MKRRVRSVIEWRRFPDEKPTSQMVLVFADGAVNTIFGNGLANFIRDGAKFVYWANLPDLRLGTNCPQGSDSEGVGGAVQERRARADFGGKEIEK